MELAAGRGDAGGFLVECVSVRGAYPDAQAEVGEVAGPNALQRGADLLTGVDLLTGIGRGGGRGGAVTTDGPRRRPRQPAREGDGCG